MSLEFDNPPETMLRWLNCLLKNLHAKLPFVEAISPETEEVALDDSLPPGWDHQIWFTVARFTDDFIGPKLEKRTRLIRPSFLLSFRIVTWLGTDEKLKIGFSPGCLRVYPGFHPQDVEKAYMWIWNSCPVAFSHYLASSMGQEPSYHPLGQHEALTAGLVAQCLHSLKGASLLLGPAELFRAKLHGLQMP